MEFIKPGPNKRVCAFFIDMLIISFFSLGVDLIMDSNYGWLISSAMFLFRDCIDGQSPGKMAVGLKVLDKDGNPCTLLDSIKRNILFMLPIVPLIEYFVLLSDKENGKRLGDRIAATRVTDLKPGTKDSVFLWISLGLAVVYAVIQLGIGWYMIKNHPEMFQQKDNSVATTQDPTAGQ